MEFYGNLLFFLHLLNLMGLTNSFHLLNLMGLTNSLHLLIFGVIFQKTCLNDEHFTFHPPRARLYIVETESRIVATDAGAKKNSRTEVKRVKTTIFKYVFVVFWSFRKKLKKYHRSHTIAHMAADHQVAGGFEICERFVSSRDKRPGASLRLIQLNEAWKA